MAPEIAAKVAKLLRMLTSSHDGEVLAAAGRLNAIVAAYYIDWDKALNGGGSALSEQDMRQIYDAAYSRGFIDGQAEVSRDWTPTAGTSAEAGDDVDRLRKILSAAEQSAADDLLNSFELEFTDSMQERVNRYGYKTYVSEKQWAVLDRLEKKLSRQGYI